MNKDKFKPVLNPFTLLLHFFIIAMFGGILVHAIATIIRKPENFSSMERIIPGVFVFLFFIYVLILTIYNLKNSFKFVTFNEHDVLVFYPLKLKTLRIERSDILGFTTCKIRYNISSVILYSNRNDIIEMTNKDIFGFNIFSNYLKLNFKYLGEEHFIPKTWIGRKYMYSDN